MGPLNTRLTGQLTIASAIATILSVVFLILFYSQVSPVFGPLNDIASILQVVLMLPALIFFAEVLRRAQRAGPTNSAGTAIAGAAGIFITGVSQTLLVVGLLPYDQTITPNMVGGGLIGLWLIATNLLMSRAALIMGMLPRIGVLAGVGYLLIVTGFTLGGMDNLLFQIGGGLMLLCYPIWGIWLGRTLIGGMPA